MPGTNAAWAASGAPRPLPLRTRRSLASGAKTMQPGVLSPAIVAVLPRGAADRDDPRHRTFSSSPPWYDRPGEAGQLALPFERAPALDTTIDSIRDRYGSGALTRGVLVGRDPGPWVPLLPD